MISETQLETWSNQGAVVTAQSTHETVRRCLKDHSLTSGVYFDDYLQGSYRNSTNIRGDSDVDIVVELGSAFKPDTSALDAVQKALFNAATPSASYGYDDFYSEVVEVLRQRFGANNVVPEKKAIKIRPGNGRIPADVVVAMTHKKYMYYRSEDDQSAIEGITIKNQGSGEWIVNYPKRHFSNGAAKNLETVGRYKPSVRMIKNARQRAVDAGYLSKGIAPSYFIECLIFNMPENDFRGTWGDIYRGTILAAISDQRQNFMCQNEVNKLFGTGADQWRLEASILFANALYKLWENF